ncbi:MAG: HDIG domain-containing metalloprotein [Pseudomonadota bacterium]
MPEPPDKPKLKPKPHNAVLVKRLEKRFPRIVPALSQPKGQRWVLITLTSLIAAFITAPESFKHYDLMVGEPAKETIVSPRTFNVRDEEATNKRRDEAMKSVPPVYEFDDEMVRDVQHRINRAFDFMDDYLAREADQSAKEEQAKRGGLTEGKADATDAKTFRPLDEKELRTRFENLLGAGVSPSTFAILKSARFNIEVQRELRALAEHVLEKGVVPNRDSVMRDGKNGILLWSKSKGKYDEKLRDPISVFDLKEAWSFINVEEKDPSKETALSRAVRRLATDLVNVNMMYDRERSALIKQEAKASVKDVSSSVAKGEPIVKKGEPVNEGHLRKLEALRKADPGYRRHITIIGFALTLILILRLSLYFAEHHLDRSWDATENLLLICILVLGTVILVKSLDVMGPRMFYGVEGLNRRSLLFAAPVAVAPMLMSLMVDPRIAFILGAVTALIATLSVDGDTYLFCFYFIGGIVGLHGVTNVTDRTSILRAGLVVGLANMVTGIAVKMALGELTSPEQCYDVALGFIGGVLSGMLVLGLAPLLEPLGYITNVRLVEIASHNHPLLRELAMAAPGTYHHSLMVGHLAEAAVERIGANPLLARVGGYYHDIGKMCKATKPSYFIENQRRGYNPHDKLEPSMSALILVSHVKHGVERGKEHRLGKPILEIIRQHHGTNLIRFFYTKALAKAEKTHSAVSEEKYRYPGPLPQTKEAAVVMLADVVEAASRTLSDPTPARIQKHTQSMVMSVFNEGQLDQSTLTLKDLHAITRSFVRTLQGMLHYRIDYPAGHRQQEKTNGDPHRQPTDKDRVRQPPADDEGVKGIRRLGL